jgi:hypothetical protein
MVHADNRGKGEAQSTGGGSQTLRQGRYIRLLHLTLQGKLPRLCSGQAWATIAVVIALLLTLQLGSGPSSTPVTSPTASTLASRRQQKCLTSG